MWAFTVEWDSPDPGFWEGRLAASVPSTPKTQPPGAVFAGRELTFLEHPLHLSAYSRHAEWLLDWFSCQFYVADFF